MNRRYSDALTSANSRFTTAVEESHIIENASGFPLAKPQRYELNNTSLYFTNSSEQITPIDDLYYNREYTKL